MTDDAKTKIKDDPKSWPRVASLHLEASLHGRRVHFADIRQAAEMASETFRSVLASKNYDMELTSDLRYDYRAADETVMAFRSPTMEETLDALEEALGPERKQTP